MKVDIQRAGLHDVHDIALMAGEYLAEMLLLAGFEDTWFQISERKALLQGFLDNADYIILVARTVRAHPLGYVTVFESRPYLDGLHGIIDQIYVRPFYRRRRIALRMMMETRQLAERMRWRRLMITLPLAFRLEPARSFFEKQGFSDPRQRKQWLRI
jgi:GNAT superfamily N-acetyltransferase